MDVAEQSFMLVGTILRKEADMAYEKNIEFHRGEDVRIRITVDGEGDITGWLPQMVLTFRRTTGEADNSTPTLELIGDAGFDIVNGPERIMDAVIPADETFDMTEESYVYDVKRVGIGVNTVILHGIATILPSATRRITLA